MFGHEAGEAGALFVRGRQPRFEVDAVGADERLGKMALAQIVGGDCPFKRHHVLAQFATERINVGVLMNGEDGKRVKTVHHHIDRHIRQGAHELQRSRTRINDERIINLINQMLRRPAANQALGFHILRLAQTAFQRRNKAVGRDGATVLTLGNALFLQIIEVAINRHQRNLEALRQFLRINDALLVQ